jgi:sigma-B regulation protein RsbU (phosphoserine phosphatase)
MNKAADSKDAAPKGSKGKGRGVRFSLRIKFSLAISILVSLVVLSISGFIIWRESNLLKDQVFQFVKRELVHLAKTTQVSLGSDEIAMIEAINDLKDIEYLSYAFILDARDRVLLHFDRRGERAPQEPIDDGIDRDLSVGEGEKADIEMSRNPNPKGPGVIYEFRRPVLSKLGGGKIGYVIIGLSDKVIRDEIRGLLKIMIPISLSFLGLAILASIILASITINPIRKLSQGAVIIGQGDLDYRIDIKSSDELGQLAREFNEMTAMIKEAKENEIEQRIMDEQLETARDIQEGLNPMAFYNKGGIQIKGYTRAAKGVGGDYFDYIEIDENRVGALLSDVSGKGVPASLVMVMIRTVFTSYITRSDVTTAQVVRAINDSLSADFAIDKFATLFFFIYDRRTGEVSFTNAGQGPLYCYRKNLNRCTATKLDGVPIGIMEDVDYKMAKVTLNPGDIIVTFSDGITEMRNEDKDEYGFSRLQKMLIEHHEKDAGELVDTIVNDVDEFRGEAPPHDDTTILIFKREY